MDSLAALKNKALDSISKVKSLADLEQFEIEFFGRKQGALTKILRSLSALPERERKSVGERAHAARRDIETWLEKKREALSQALAGAELEREKIDISFPGTRRERGHLHPLTQIRLRSEEIFGVMGFAAVEGPEVDTEFYNFDALNVPREHPARDMQDTFWLAGEDTRERYLPRTHTSSVQVRYMEKHTPPFRIIVPGKVFRHEATDASHDIEFWQLEGLMVGRDVSVAHLKYVLEVYFRKMFGKKVQVRLRPSFFPFTEPSFEFDMTCVACAGGGCGVCKKSGWLELGGCGMVHQNVFASAGYAKGEWQGFAFGMGLDRIAMMKYKIPDVRLFRENDIRFLKQF